MLAQYQASDREQQVRLVGFIRYQRNVVVLARRARDTNIDLELLARIRSIAYDPELAVRPVWPYRKYHQRLLVRPRRLGLYHPMLKGRALTPIIFELELVGRAQKANLAVIRPPQPVPVGGISIRDEGKFDLEVIVNGER